MKIEIAVSMQNAEDVKNLKSILENLPEYSVSMPCTRFNYKAMEFTFEEDTEERGPGRVKTHTMNLAKAMKGWEMLLAAVCSGKLPGLHMSPGMFGDPGEYDADMVDALIQFAVLGEVIYG